MLRTISFSFNPFPEAPESFLPCPASMKEDAMKNGQLKPAYNMQHGVDAEYITWLTVAPELTDITTLIPFLKSMEENLNLVCYNQ